MKKKSVNKYPNLSKLSEGVKYDDGKPPMDLLSYPALEELSKVLGMGKNKYGAYNWLNGVDYSRLIAAALRHLHQYNSGIDKDDESGLSHIAHCMCNLMFLLHFEKTGRIELDNRYKGKLS